MLNLRRITRLEPALLDGLAELLCDAVDGGASIGFLAGLDRAEAERYWQALAPSLEQDVCCWVIEEAGRVLGSVQLGLCHKPNGRHRAELQKLMVLRSARGRGLASQLMLEAERAAMADGRRLLVLDTEAGSAAERLYLGHGWQRSGEVPDYACSPDGRPHATVIFWKALPPVAARPPSG